MNFSAINCCLQLAILLIQNENVIESSQSTIIIASIIGYNRVICIYTHDYKVCKTERRWCLVSVRGSKTGFGLNEKIVGQIYHQNDTKSLLSLNVV